MERPQLSRCWALTWELFASIRAGKDALSTAFRSHNDITRTMDVIGGKRIPGAVRRAGLAHGIAMLLFAIGAVALLSGSTRPVSDASSPTAAVPAAHANTHGEVTSGAAAMQALTLPEGIPDFSTDTVRTTVASVQSGIWSNPSTWQGGQVPALNNVVRVVLGHTVTIDDTSAVAYTIAVDGTLAFAPTVNTRLKVTNLQVMAGEMGMGTRGILQVGTAAAPIAADVTAEIVIANSPLGGSVADPSQFGTGLMIFGKASMHGSVRTPTFVRVAAEPRAGNTTLLLSAPVSGWRAGDRLVLPDTRHMKESEVTGGGWINAVNQWEERTVQAISPDGLAVTLNTALQYDHLGARDQAGVLDPGFLPHLGNLTRNVIIRSENPAGIRGHMLATHVADVDMRYVLFKDLGRTTFKPLNTTTNHIGRYPVHMHHLSGPLPTPDNGYQFTLLGNAVDGGSAATEFKWGIAVHGSHYGLIQDNVVYNYNGASVATEDGSESFNVFDHNFALRGIGEPNDLVNGIEARSAMGTEGVGFWFRGPNNYVRNNVAANFQNPTTEAAYGFVFQFRGPFNIAVPNFKGANTFMGGAGQSTIVSANSLPLRQFDNNEAYGAMQGGFTYWWVSSLDPDPSAGAQESLIQDLKLWNIYNKAVYMYPGQKVTFAGLKIRGSFHVDNRCCGDGVYAADYSSKGIVIRDSDIQGMTKGITAPMAGFGPEPNLTIQNSYLRNLRNVVVPINGSVNGCWMENKLIVVSNTLFVTVPGQSSTHIGMVGDVAFVGLNVCLDKLDEARVYAYNADATDNFQVYHTSASVLPRPPPACGTPTTRIGIDGLVCPIPALGPVPPTATLNVSPTFITAGLSTTLTWSSINAVTVSIDQGNVTYSGTLSVSPATTTTYTLTATNDAGSVTRTASVTVGPPDTTAPVISAVASSSLTKSGATIGFTTDEPTRHQVQYGPTMAYGTTTALDPMLMTSHSQVLTGLAPGTLYHYRALATDASGNVGMSGDFAFLTPVPPPLAAGTVVFADGNSTVTAGPFNTAAGDLVVAFATGAGPAGGGQSFAISGGLTWTLVTREDGMPGVAEIWKASSPTAQSGISVTSTPALGGFTQSLTVVTFPGAAGVGASAGANGPSGGPSIQLTTTQAGSLVYAVGNDWDGALARTLGANQSMTHEWVSTPSGDTYWVQNYNGPIAAAGSAVQLNDTAPTNHRWNFAAVEIRAKQTPVITWSPPASVTYGTALNGTQLNATAPAGVVGTLVYSPASGELLRAGAQTLAVTFTPADTATYDIATATVPITVLKATPVITWPAPAEIVYGTPLSGTQLNATAPVGLAGTLVYTPASGALLGAGGRTLSVTFTPTNTADYNAATMTAPLTVLKATPAITWPAPAQITYGTALGGMQLNATAPVAGTFAYTPASGELLGAGAGQTLSVTFNPTNAADYNASTAAVALTVLKATPAITWPAPAALTYGTPLTGTQLNATAPAAGTFAYTPVSGTLLGAGVGQPLSVTFTPTNTANYNPATASVALTVLKATPVITWPAPTPIAVGTALGGTQLNATAPVAGTFVYTPPSGTLLEAGAGQTLSVTLTPTNTADYNPATATVAITLLPLSLPTVAVVNPASGSTAGGTAVTISGTGFVTGATVTIGGTAATSVNVVSAQTITAATAAHAAGAVTVMVTNPDGQLATRTNGFTYFVPATDGPLQRGISIIRAAHIIELRQRINALRARLNLSQFAWSDAALSPGMPIRAQHIIDLRAALHEFYVASDRTPPTYTDPTIEAGKTTMRVEHITEIRTALIAIE